MVNDTSDLAVDRDFSAVDGLGRQQVFACIGSKAQVVPFDLPP